MYDISLRSYSTAAVERNPRAYWEQDEFTILQELDSFDGQEGCPRLCLCSRSTWTSVLGTDTYIRERHVDHVKHQQPEPTSTNPHGSRPRPD